MSQEKTKRKKDNKKCREFVSFTAVFPTLKYKKRGERRVKSPFEERGEEKEKVKKLQRDWLDLY